jgi:hypothetical protein
MKDVFDLKAESTIQSLKSGRLQEVRTGPPEEATKSVKAHSSYVFLCLG